MTQGHGIVLQRIVIHRHAIRRTNGILSAVTLADRILLIVFAVEMETQVADDFVRFLRQTVFFYQRHDGQFYRSQCLRQFEHYASFPVFQFLFLVAVAHDGKEHTVHTDRGLNDIRRIAFVRFGVEIFTLLARILGMLAQIKVRTAVGTFHFLETEWHVELDVTGRIGIVRQFLMVVETVVFRPET